MTKLVCLLALVLAVACSKSKPAEQGAGSSTTTTTPPPVADAAQAAPADAADTGSGAPAMDGSGSSAAAGSGAGSSADDGPQSDFDKLSHDDKIKFMKTKVMPAMKPLFQKFDAKEYANFGCKTCHGKDPQKAKYKMPNPDLKALDFEAIKAGKEDPKMVDFMSKKVKPEMAKVFGVPEMTQTEPKGFGCLDCHTMKK
ncbi:MAG TPA: hypothetical protein VMZ53_07145 [Kofleriaceae bacterium]|nr:hypothetical protein [Kofleriaceae bacterium]